MPQLYTKPSAKALLDTLALLTSAPPSWEFHSNSDGDGDAQPAPAESNTIQVNPEGVTRYLTSIVSSSLRWIEDEDSKEEIWNQASLRLSERSGRSAMSALSRKFRIPSATGSFELSIHEPALTGDGIGLKTWAASYMLAKRLHTFNLVQLDMPQRPQVLELGSGTGLVGLAMAGLGADVVLTDLPSIYANLARNAEDNAETTRQNGGVTRTGILDWTNPTLCRLPTDATSSDEGEIITTKFPLILAADSLYSPDHPRMLVESIDAWLSPNDSARVIIEFPYRQAYLPEIKDFRQRMEGIGLHVLEEGEEQGYDDWSRSDANGHQDETALVTCWWACWGRQNSGG